MTSTATEVCRGQVGGRVLLAFEHYIIERELNDPHLARDESRRRVATSESALVGLATSRSRRERAKSRGSARWPSRPRSAPRCRRSRRRAASSSATLLLEAIAGRGGPGREGGTRARPGRAREDRKRIEKIFPSLSDRAARMAGDYAPSKELFRRQSGRGGRRLICCRLTASHLRIVRLSCVSTKGLDHRHKIKTASF